MSYPPITQSLRRPVRIVLGAGPHSRLVGLVQYLERDGEIVVVDRCRSYGHVLRSLPATVPDLIAVELDLLGATAAEAAQRITQARPARVVVFAGAADQRSERAHAALAAGAVAVLSGSAIELNAPDTASARSFRCQFRRFAFNGASGSAARGQHGTSSAARTAGATVIGICASTGGPQVLETLLGRLPVDFQIPILVVQHMMPGFTEGLVTWLDGQVAPAVGLARDGQDLTPGVWFAPDGSHLVLGRCGRLALAAHPPLRGHRPSGDLLLGSLAEIAGAGAAGVVLTGMGRDGAGGLAAASGSVVP